MTKKYSKARHGTYTATRNHTKQMMGGIDYHLNQIAFLNMVKDALINKHSEPNFQHSYHDLHAWLVLPNGKILDYPKHKLCETTAFPSDKIKYVPFDEETQQKCKDYWFDRYEKRILSGEFAASNDLEQDQVGLALQQNTGFCQFRSIYLYNRMKNCKTPPKLVFGSLGFIQRDGSVFYEYG